MTENHEKKITLVDKKGRRKYLNAEERAAFIEATYKAPAHERTLCFVLTYTGCRVAEALNVTVADIDFPGEAIFLGLSEKQRRGVPLPPFVLQALDGVHGVRHAQQQPDGGQALRLWPIDRTTAFRWVDRIMGVAGIEGPKAAPRGLRHGFCVQALRDGTPLETLRRWMGYATTEIAAVYVNPPDGL
jgi:integrase